MGPMDTADKSYAAQFEDFHRRINAQAAADAAAQGIPAPRKKLFTPDFFDSQLRIMADPGRDLEERTLSWSKYRAWGSYNEYACYGRGDTRALTQRDCGIDLAHLQAGKPIEWIDAARARDSPELVPRAPIDKSCLSRAFSRNRETGYLRKDGQRVYPIVSPPPAPPTPDPKSSLTAENFSPRYRAFLESWKVADSTTFDAWQVANAEAKKLNKIAVSKYREWVRAERKRQSTPLTASNNLKGVPAAAAVPSDTDADAIATTTAAAPARAKAPETKPRPRRAAETARTPRPATPPARPEAAAIAADDVAAVAVELAKYGPADDAAARQMIAEARAIAPDVTAAELVGLSARKAQQINRATTNPLGLLIRGVPRMCEGASFQQFRGELKAAAEAAAANDARNRAAMSEWIRELRADLADPRRAADHDEIRRQLADLESNPPEEA